LRAEVGKRVIESVKASLLSLAKCPFSETAGPGLFFLSRFEGRPPAWYHTSYDPILIRGGGKSLISGVWLLKRF